MINVDDRIYKTGLAAKMKPTGVSIYFAIATHQNNKNAAWPSLDRICELTGVKKDAAYKAIKSLIELGLIERKQTKQKDSKKFGKTIYILKCKYIKTYVENTRKPLAEKPCTGKPKTDTPHRVLPYTVKPDKEVLIIKEVLTNVEREEHTHTKTRPKQPDLPEYAKASKQVIEYLKTNTNQLDYILHNSGFRKNWLWQAVVEDFFRRKCDNTMILRNPVKYIGWIEGDLKQARTKSQYRPQIKVETPLKPIPGKDNRAELLKVIANAQAKYK